MAAASTGGGGIMPAVVEEMGPAMPAVVEVSSPTIKNTTRRNNRGKNKLPAVVEMGALNNRTTRKNNSNINSYKKYKKFLGNRFVHRKENLVSGLNLKNVVTMVAVPHHEGTAIISYFGPYIALKESNELNDYSFETTTQLIPISNFEKIVIQKKQKSFIGGFEVNVEFIEFWKAIPGTDIDDDIERQQNQIIRISSSDKDGACFAGRPEYLTLHRCFTFPEGETFNDNLRRLRWYLGNTTAFIDSPLGSADIRSGKITAEKARTLE